jgi:hypothetical protein
VEIDLEVTDYLRSKWGKYALNCKVVPDADIRDHILDFRAGLAERRVAPEIEMGVGAAHSGLSKTRSIGTNSDDMG